MNASSHITCVWVPDFALQTQELGGQASPLAIVASNAPHAPLSHIDAQCRHAGLSKGMRLSLARQILPSLRVCVQDDAALQQEGAELAASLRIFSPMVEYDQDDLGVFFLDAKGLLKLYGNLQTWGHSVQQYLRGWGLDAVVVTGFSRQATLGIAKHVAQKKPLVSKKKHVKRQTSSASSTPSLQMMQQRNLVIESKEQERIAFDAVPLSCLGLSQTLMSTFERLSAHCVRDVRRLPCSEIHTRFGEEARILWQRLNDNDSTLHTPLETSETPRVTQVVEPPDSDPHRLLFGIKSALDTLTNKVSAAQSTIKTLHLCLELDVNHTGMRFHYEHIIPAQPTTHVRTLLELMRLRLQGLTLPANVVEMVLEAEDVPQTSSQRLLGEEGEAQERWLRAEHTFAQLRSLLRTGALFSARLRDAHLPEARFEWLPLQGLKAGGQRADSRHVITTRPTGSRAGTTKSRTLPYSNTSASRVAASELATAESAKARQIPSGMTLSELALPGQSLSEQALSEQEGLKGLDISPLPPVLVRRIFAKPERLRTKGGLILDPRGKPFSQLHGPYRFNGGWWVRKVTRDYYYGETQNGELLWIYYDQARNTWFQQGIVD